MAREPDREMLAEAVAWHLRLQSGADRDWEEFVEWLEADPARSQAYDQVEAGHAAITAGAFAHAADPSLIGAADETPRARWRGLGIATALAAMAAAILIALFATPLLTSAADRYEVATAPGERRDVQIADGSTVSLNGGTRVILDRNDPGVAELVTGEASFTIRHGRDRPFTVIAGEHRVQDVGTSFNLVRDSSDFSVEVIEGAVIYDPHRSAVRLGAGQTLRVSGNARPVVARQNPQDLAAWRRGRLSYAGAPLSRVTRDVSRTLGVDVAVDPEVAALPFTGSIRISGEPGATVNDLATSVGLRARRAGRGWLIEPHTRALR
jgi:transmembrane sensor